MFCLHVQIQGFKKKNRRAFVSIYKEGKEPRNLGWSPKNKKSTRKAVAIARRIAGTKTA
jgi:hypothetical protein